MNHRLRMDSTTTKKCNLADVEYVRFVYNADARTLTLLPSREDEVGRLKILRAGKTRDFDAPFATTLLRSLGIERNTTYPLILHDGLALIHAEQGRPIT
jgi:hypothetical protein